MRLVEELGQRALDLVPAGLDQAAAPCPQVSMTNAMTAAIRIGSQPPWVILVALAATKLSSIQKNVTPKAPSCHGFQPNAASA